MVVWLSCYAFVPVIFVMAYDKAKKFINKCCKKKGDNSKDVKISKSEKEQLNKEVQNIENNKKNEESSKTKAD